MGPSHGFALGRGALGHDQRRSALEDGFLGDHDLADILAVGQIVHDVRHHRLEYRPQTARAGAALERLLGHRAE